MNFELYIFAQIKILINLPTKVTANSESGIDNLLTNNHLSSLQVEGVIRTLSDHDGQILKIKHTLAIENSYFL